MGKYIVDIYIEGIGSLEIEAINENEAIHKAKKLTINQVLDICHINLSSKVVWVDFMSKTEITPITIREPEKLSAQIPWLCKSSSIKESKNGYR